MFCPKCGTQNADDGRFCLKCGANLHPEATPVTPAAAEAPTKAAAKAKPEAGAGWPRIFGIIAAVGVVLGLVSSLLLLISNIVSGGFLSGLRSVFSANRIFTGLFLIAGAVVFFIPATKKYPFIVAIPRVVLGLITFISSIKAIVDGIRYSMPFRYILPDIFWLLAGILFCLAGVACLLAFFFKDKLKGKEKLAVMILGGVSVLVVLLGLLASLLEFVSILSFSFPALLGRLSAILFHAALLGPMVSVLYVNLGLFGMEPKDLKDLFKKASAEKA